MKTDKATGNNYSYTVLRSRTYVDMWMRCCGFCHLIKKISVFINEQLLINGFLILLYSTRSTVLVPANAIQPLTFFQYLYRSRRRACPWTLTYYVTGSLFTSGTTITAGFSHSVYHYKLFFQCLDQLIGLI